MGGAPDSAAHIDERFYSFRSRLGAGTFALFSSSSPVLTSYPTKRNAMPFPVRSVRRRSAVAALSVLSLLLLAAGGTLHAQDKKTLKVGISVGSAEQIFEVVKKVAARDGLTLDVVVFNDYQLPNAALASKDLDANAFQHQPFLDNQNKARGFDIVPVGLTITAPLGFYSRKIKSIDQLPEGASVGIQNDPSNGNRALLLLQEAKLVTLRPEAVKSNTATPLDVTSNPKKLKLVPLDAAQLPRSLDDLSIAAINNDYAEKAGLTLAKDAVIKESPTGPYANLIAVRRADKDAPWAKQLVKAYQSPEVKAFIETKFKGALVPAF
jgi:D-methionine transport system substrate-binding protein